MIIPKELIVLASAMLPFSELNGAIPLGVFLGLPIEAAFFWAEVGNIIPIMLILKLFGPISTWLMKHSVFFKRFFTKIFDTTRQKHSQKIDKLGAVFLAGFIAIPLPGAGAWTASLIAFLFNFPYWRAVGIIFIGNICAGILVSLGIGGALEIIKFLK